VPKVSVIIPTYNRPELLVQAVESVLAQTFKDLEVIVVDDGSEEGDIPPLTGITDDRIRFIRQEHSGRSTARNQGIAEARGEFIAFLDDDDYYLPDKLGSEVHFLDANPDVDLVSGGSILATPEGEHIAVLRPWESQPEITLLALLNTCLFTTCAIMVRKQTLKRMEQWFDPNFHLGEDWDFYLRLSLTDACMKWLPEVNSVCRSYRYVPLKVLIEQKRWGKKVLDKLFFRPDLPVNVRKLKGDAYRHYYLVCSARAYLCQCTSLAQYALLQALIVDPRTLDNTFHQFIDCVVYFATGPYCDRDPDVFINYVFDHLPSAFAHLLPERDQLKQLIQQKP
jgi:glycosyltransferase involved in cell wall biosynthesis